MSGMESSYESLQLGYLLQLEEEIAALYEGLDDRSDILLPHEECGVFAAVMPDGRAVQLVRAGIVQLENRGNQGAGIAYFDEEHERGQIGREKALGHPDFVMQAVPKSLEGNMALAHTVYATSERDDDEGRNAALQPCIQPECSRPFALSHNGNFTNTDELSKKYGIEAEAIFSDSHLVAQILAIKLDESPEHEFKDVLKELLPELKGAFSMAIMNTKDNEMFAVRDRFGFRPLVIGHVEGVQSRIISSETFALDQLGAQVEREVYPGEILKIDENGRMRSDRFVDEPAKEADRRHCLLEMVYFANPESYYMDAGQHIQIDEIRVQTGRHLAHMEDPDFEADIVLGIPDSGISPAEGYAEVTGLFRAEGIRKNRRITDRSFQLEGQEQREQVASDKYRLQNNKLRGQRVVIVDDSVVRGTTTLNLIERLRNAGVAEIHLRVAFPEVRFPCYFGVDMPNRDLLIANRHKDAESIAEELGVDSINFIPLKGLLQSIDDVSERPVKGHEHDIIDNFCTACITGNYPRETPVELLRIAGVEPPEIKSS